MDLAQIVADTLETEGGAFAVTHRPNLVDGAPPWRLQVSFGGADHPGRPTQTRAAYGFGETAAEALDALVEDLQRELDDAEQAGR
jgi:hypothetical protein